MKVLYPTFSFFYIPAACTLQCPKKLVLSSDPDPVFKKTYRLLRIQEWNFDDYRSHCILGLHGGNHFQVIMYHTVSSKSYHLIVMSSYQLSYFHSSTQIQLDFPSYHNTGTVESKAQGGFQMKLHRRYTVLLNSLRHYRINSMVGAILLAKAFLCC